MHGTWLRIGATVAMTLGVSACGTAPARPGNGMNGRAVERALSDSSIDITYTLGHSHRRFYIEAASSNVRGECYLDRMILKQASIEPDKYRDFLLKVSDFVTKKRGVASTPVLTSDKAEAGGECRSPFTVTFRTGKDTQTLTGCRSTDEGSFSRLLKDGEFLLYSQK